ncbi:MAG: cytoplasmic protein [Promethearchaeota archaeon]|nr:MAG: cytoplasmic protein [Candidatus Lokiarchaeota archaeon]
MADKKYALYAFNGDPMCFIHVILNAIDMDEKGFDVKVIVEGSACKLVEEFENESNPMHSLYKKLEDKDLLDCFCKACSNKMGVLEKVEKMGFPTCDEMMGHPSMAKYIEKGYNIITF